MVHTELKLNMHILLDGFSQFEPIAFIEDTPELTLAKVRMFQPEGEGLSESEQTIYIAPYSSLPLIDDNQTRYNVVCPDRENDDISAWENLNLICLNGVLSCSELFKFLQEIFEKYYIWHQKMLDIIMNSSSKQELMNTASEMLQNPLLIFDYSIKPLTDICVDTSLLSGTDWEQVLKIGDSLLDNYTEEQKKKFLSNLNYNKKPFLFKADKAAEHTQLFVNLYMEKTRIGCLGMIDIAEHFSTGQISLVNHIKNLVEAIIHRSEKYQYLIEHDSLIERMLNGYYVEEKLVQSHLDKIRWRVKDSFLILVFDNLVRHFPDSYKSYCFKLNQLFKLSVIIPFNEHLIMILNAANLPIEQVTANKEFRRFLTRLSVSCGISQKFEDFLDLKYYTRQAVSALKEGQKKNSEGPFFFYKNYFIEDMINSLEKDASLQSFCHPQILSLKKHDDDSGSEYVKTLYHYLLCGKKLTEAADSLFIHRNTLKYRLSRIQELVDYNFNDTENVFQTLASCRFVEFM